MTPDEQTARLALREAIAEVARQVDAILDSAIAAAADIRAQAERDAERHLAHRREMANQVLAAQVERLEKFSSELLTETDRALASPEFPAASRPSASPLSAGTEPSRPPLAGAFEPGGNGTSAPQEPPAPAGPDAPGPSISREEAVLQATQMAIAKVDRTEIEATLRQELGAEQSRQIVEAVLGSR